MGTRWIGCLISLLMLGSLTFLWGCGSIAPCEGQFSQLSFNPNGSPCEQLCHCNNQAYEGICLEKRCRSRRRDVCSIKGQIRGCKLLAPVEGTTCLDGTQACHPDGLTDRLWGDCEPLKTIAKEENTKELCLDRIDNDCDGKVDLEEEACKDFCNRGDTRQCYTGKAGTVNVGRCAYGTQYCDPSTNLWFAACDGEVTPAAAEICNGVDDNCDGKIDEGLPDCLCQEAQKGKQEPCFTGPVGSETYGICRSGRRECKEVETGVFRWGKCENEVLPKKDEECNGLDDNCNGLVDEGCPCTGDARSCGHDIGECRQGEQRCELGRWSRSCSAQIAPRGELCDNRDNDCNGYIDDRLQRDCKTACGAGLETCVAGKWEGCTAPPAAPETCNDKDDDCDGVVDNGLSRACKNDCGEGLETCVKGAWSKCNVASPPPEVCDGKDNNCNGLIDEGLAQECTTPCGQGVQLCTTGKWSQCIPANPPPETCNDKDDNCNGQIDEGLFRTCEAACGKSIQLCEKGKWTECSVPKVQKEVCNGVDDNCDGAVDENLSRPCDAAKCLSGTETCVDAAWTGCTSTATPETCDNKDNDCNGQIDEGLTKPCDTVTCEQGLNFCIKGSWKDTTTGIGYGCVKIAPPEDCNGKDDNCNGQIDEGVTTRACDASKCLQGTETCTNGTWQGTCNLVAPPEVCDGKDNNCNGQIDEGNLSGCVYLLAGVPNSAGNTNGAVGVATFSSPLGIVPNPDNSDILWLADTGNHQIRNIALTTNGDASTIGVVAGSGTAGIANGKGAAAQFNAPSNFSSSSNENGIVVVVDTGNHCLRNIKITTLDVTVYSGTPGMSGYVDGKANVTKFQGPLAVFEEYGATFVDYYVADSLNHRIRKIEGGISGTTTTFGDSSLHAGQATAGSANGIGAAASFNKPGFLTPGPQGSIIVLDTGNHCLRSIDSTKSVTTIVGTCGTSGASNGVGAAARFNEPTGASGGFFTSDGMLVADSKNHCIRKIVRDSTTGTYTVTTYAGICGTSGYRNGPRATALFNNPTHVLRSYNNDIYVVDTGNHVIRKIKP